MKKLWGCGQNFKEKGLERDKKRCTLFDKLYLFYTLMFFNVNKYDFFKFV